MTEKNSKELAPWGLNEDVINQIIKEADDREHWARLDPNGFRINGHIYPRIAGRIQAVSPHWIKWKGGQPIKDYSEERPDDPEYKRRCDIQLKTVDNNTVNISLAPTSYRNLKIIIKEVYGNGTKLDDVMLGLSVNEVKGKRGNKFCIVNFEYLDAKGNIIPESPWTSAITAKNDDIRF